MSRTPQALLFLVVFSAIASISSHVNAQSCALLPPGETEGRSAPDTARRQALDAVSTHLSREGVTVISPEDAQRRLLGTPACNAIECGGSVANQLGVDFAVLVTVWAPRGRPTSVVVVLIAPDGESSAGDAPITETLADATNRALATARQRFRANRMGFLSTSSVPAGAEVQVNGETIGTTPIRRMLPAGAHALVVRLDGYTQVSQEVRIDPHEEQSLDLTLIPNTQPAEALPNTRTQAGHALQNHWSNWIIGGVLIAGGITSLIAPLATLADAGSCAQPIPGDDGFCARVVRFAPTDGILLGAGIAALGGGFAMMFAQPIQIQVALSDTAASMRVSGRF